MPCAIDIYVAKSKLWMELNILYTDGYETIYKLIVKLRITRISLVIVETVTLFKVSSNSVVSITAFLFCVSFFLL